MAAEKSKPLMDKSATTTRATKPDLEAIVRKNADISDVLNTIKSSAVLGVASSILALILMVIAINHESPPRYVAIDNDDRIVKLYPLHEPVLTDAAVSAWTSNVVVDTFSTDFLNYRRLLKTSKPFFTDKGWVDFSDLYEKEFVDLIKKFSAVSRAVPKGAPVVEGKGMMDGAYTWKLSQPFLVEYFSGTKSRAYDYMFTVYVQRVPTSVNPMGIAISRVVTSLGGRDKKDEF